MNKAQKIPPPDRHSEKAAKMQTTICTLIITHIG